MATGYTDAELEALREEAIRRAPPHPTHKDLRTAPKLERLATAGTEMGALVRLALKGRIKRVTFFLNPVLTLELMLGIHKAAISFNWWEDEQPELSQPLPELERADLEKAVHVSSITTSSVPEGLLVRFGGGGVFTFFIPRTLAAEVVSALDAIGETAKWWDRNFRLLGKLN